MREKILEITIRLGTSKIIETLEILVILVILVTLVILEILVTLVILVTLEIIKRHKIATKELEVLINSLV
jgi:hypothetical protein